MFPRVVYDYKAFTTTKFDIPFQRDSLLFSQGLYRLSQLVYEKYRNIIFHRGRDHMILQVTLKVKVQYKRVCFNCLWDIAYSDIQKARDSDLTVRFKTHNQRAWFGLPFEIWNVDRGSIGRNLFQSRCHSSIFAIYVLLLLKLGGLKTPVSNYKVSILYGQSFRRLHQLKWDYLSILCKSLIFTWITQIYSSYFA